MLSFLSFSALAIEAKWLSYTLIFLSIGFFIFVIFTYMRSAGEKAQKKLHANDLLRMRIVETGDDIQIDKQSEYSIYKGFLIGACSCLPMVLFLLIHTIIGICGGTTNVLGAIGNFLYLLFAAPVFVFTESTLSFGEFYICLYGLALSSLVSGLGYYIGSRKVLLQYEKIEESKKLIYGE